MPQKILWVNYAASTKDESGPTRHYELAQRINELDDLSCTVVASSIHHGSQTNRLEGSRDLYELRRAGDVDFLWINSPKSRAHILSRIFGMLSFSLNLFRTLTREEIKGDIYVGSSPHLLQALITYFAAKKARAKFYLEVRDIWPESLVEIGGFSRFHPAVLALSVIEKFLYRKAVCIIGVLPGFPKYLESIGIKAAVIYAPNCPSVTNLSKEDGSALPRENTLEKAAPTTSAPARDFTFIYAGAHGLAQNLLSVVKAAEILDKKPAASRIKVRFIGGGFEKKRLVDYAKEHAVTNVEFLEPVAKNKIARELSRADAAILHLKNLSLFNWGISPNKLFDYLSVKLPVLFAVNTDFHSLEKYPFGIKASADEPENIASKMLEMATLPRKTLSEMGENGYKYIEAEHNFDDVVKRITHEFLKND